MYQIEGFGGSFQPHFNAQYILFLYYWSYPTCLYRWSEVCQGRIGCKRVAQSRIKEIGEIIEKRCKEGY